MSENKIEIKFSDEQLKEIQHLIDHYPQKKAALGDVTYMAQETFGVLTEEVELYIAELLDLPVTYVHQVLSFYTLYRRQPIGRNLLMLCDNISCMLCGAEELVEHLKHKLGIQPGETTPDGKITFWTVECLGACEMAPMVLLGGKFHGKLTREKLDEIIDNLD